MAKESVESIVNKEFFAEGGADKAQLLYDRLKQTYGRRIWQRVVGDFRLECWITRTGGSLLIQVWRDGNWGLYTELANSQDNNAIDSIK